MSYLDQEEKIFIGQAVFEFEGLHKLKDHSSGQEQLVSLLCNKTKIVNLLMIYMLSIYILLNYLLKPKMCSYLGKNSVAERANIQNLLQFEGTIQDGETQKFGEWVQN